MPTQIVSFKCVLKTKYGQIISSSVNRDVLTCLQDGDALLSGLAKGLQGIAKGERRSISLPAEQAYGFYDPKKVILYPRKKISDSSHLRPGQEVCIGDKSGKIRCYRFQQMFGEMVSLDGNHPLAGQDLIFEIETIDARDATPAEVSAANNMVSTQLLH